MTAITSDVLGPMREIDPVERFIHRLATYGSIEAAARDALRRAVQRLPQVAAHETLRENVSPDVSILLTGWVCHFRPFHNGRRQITSVIVPGDLVDFGFLTGGSRHLQFRATTASQFGRIRMSQFSELAEEFPSTMLAVLRAASIESAMRQERIISLGVRTAVERLSHFLCELCHRLGTVGLVDAENSFDLPMTQADLGEALGLSMVHVNRTVQILRRRGTITMRRGRVWLHDPVRLAAVAGFDPEYLGYVPS